MTCSAASTLQPQAAPSLLPLAPPTTPGAWERVRTAFQQVLQMIQGAAGTTGVNVIPQQYALLAGSTLPPIAALSNCTVAQDATKPLFGAGGSYKISITGSPATVTFSADTAWPLHPGWQWIASFFQQASAAIAGVLTITTPTKAYTTDFATTLSAEGWERLFDTLNLGADTSTTFGLSFTFTGGAGQTVWLDGLMMEPYFNVAMSPSPFVSTSGALTADNLPQGNIYSTTLNQYLSNGIPYTYVGAYAAGTQYAKGQAVTYGGNYYLCTATPPVGTDPTNGAYWLLSGPINLDALANGATYSKLLSTYVSGGIAFNYVGVYAAGTQYAVGQEVTYSNNYYLCTARPPVGTVPTNAAYWLLVGPANLADIAGQVTGAQIAAQTVTAANIAAGTITSGLIAAGTILGGNIAGNTITGANIAGSTITGGNIAAGTITSGLIEAGTIVAGNIAAKTITAGNIVSGAVSTVSQYSAYTGADPFDTDPPTGWLEIAQNLSATIWSGNFSGAYTTIVRAKIGFYAGIAALAAEAKLYIDGVEQDVVGGKIWGSPVPCVVYGQLEAYISDPAEGNHTIEVICYNKAGSNNYNYWYSMPVLSILRLLN